MDIPATWMEFSGLTNADIPVIREEAYPPVHLRYRALNALSPDEVRVVILGQDPYHGEGEADGYAFSVPNGIKMPPSLRNIFAELATDLGVPPPKKTDLTRWMRQGVLLLNTALTVAPNQPGSHARLWRSVTDAIIGALGESHIPRVFVLWGKHAQSKRALIPEDSRYLVIQSPHPSPFSAYTGFFGSRPFSQINVWLNLQKMPEIDWQ